MCVCNEIVRDEKQRKCEDDERKFMKFCLFTKYIFTYLSIQAKSSFLEKLKGKRKKEKIKNCGSDRFRRIRISLFEMHILQNRIKS